MAVIDVILNFLSPQFSLLAFLISLKFTLWSGAAWARVLLRRSLLSLSLVFPLAACRVHVGLSALLVLLEYCVNGPAKGLCTRFVYPDGLHVLWSFGAVVAAVVRGWSAFSMAARGSRFFRSGFLNPSIGSSWRRVNDWSVSLGLVLVVSGPSFVVEQWRRVSLLGRGVSARILLPPPSSWASVVSPPRRAFGLTSLAVSDRVPRRCV